MLQAYLKNIHCSEETDGLFEGPDEPYVLVTSVNLAASVNVAGFPVPLPAFDVVRYGPFDDVDEGETHFAPGISQSFWGVTGKPQPLLDPDSAIFVVSLVENDDGNPENLRGVVKGIVGGSVFGSLALSREAKIAALVRDITAAVGTPTGAPNFDNPLGTHELRFSADELKRAEAGEIIGKALAFNGDGGRYELAFEAINPAFFRDWALLDDNPASASIVADGNALYQLHQNGLIWRYTGTPKIWEKLDNNGATRQIVASGGKLYQRHANGAIFQFTGTPLTGWALLDDNPASASIVADGNALYQLHQNGLIWRYTGTPKIWEKLDNNAATRQIVASGGKLYQRHANGAIFQFTGTPLTGWALLDDNPASASIVADGNALYQLHQNGLIWRYTGTPKIWEKLDNNAATRQIVASGGKLYQRHANGAIFQFTGTPLTGWALLDDNPATAQIATSAGQLYQIHTNGLIWRHTKP